MTITAEPEFMDGFDGLSAAQSVRKWNTGGGTIVAGRSGISGAQAIAPTSVMRRTVTSVNAGIMQFAWKSPASLATMDICNFYNSTGGGAQTKVAITAGGVLQLINGQTFGLIGQATDPLQSIVPSTWYYFELAALMHESAGKADLKVNGAQITGCYGLTGKATSTSARIFDAVELDGGAADRIFDDFFYRPAPGGYTNSTDFLGDLVIETVYPDAVSADAGHTQGTLYGGSTNRFDGLDEINAANDETDGVDLTVNGQKLYTSFGSLLGPPGSVIGTIYGVQINIIARKTDPGFSHAITPGCVKAGVYGTDYLGVSQSLQDTFTDKRKAWAVRPDGSGSWTTTDIATAWEWGCQRDS